MPKKKATPTETPTATPILKFTAPTCDVLREHMQAALQTVEQQMGIKLRIGRMGYSTDTITMKVEAATISGDGLAYNSPAATFLREYAQYGFKKDDIGRKFMCKGHRYEFLGFTGTRTRYAVCKRDDGQTRGFRDPEFVSACIGNNPYATTWGAMEKGDINKQVTIHGTSFTILGVDYYSRVVVRPNDASSVWTSVLHFTPDIVLKALGRAVPAPANAAPAPTTAAA